MENAEVGCPCCHNALYTHPLHDEGLIGQDSPAIQQDSNGHYLKCPHCAMRIGVHKADGGGFQLDPHQQCDRKLP
jgi:hypothetical protein